MDGRLGHMGEFVPSKEEWNQYAERMGHLFEANTIESAVRRKACFLTLIGAPAYKLLGSLIQRRLLAEGDLSFEKALEMALGIEAAAENARAIWSARTVSEEGTTVNQLSMKRVSAENTHCYWCGVIGHTTS